MIKDKIVKKNDKKKMQEMTRVNHVQLVKPAHDLSHEIEITS